MWLLADDAHSEWPEVIPMQITISESTISVLRQIFCKLSLTMDHNLQRQNSNNFVRKLVLAMHLLVALYHPSSNGKAERFVQTFKQAAESNETRYQKSSRKRSKVPTKRCCSMSQVIQGRRYSLGSKLQRG